MLPAQLCPYDFAMTTEDVEKLRRRAVAFVATYSPRHGAKTALADLCGLSRQWVTAFVDHKGSCSEESYEKLLAALDAHKETSKEIADDSPIGVAVRELRLLADILASPEISNEVKADRYEAFINSAALGLRVFYKKKK